jgi:hypothetical protein
MRNPFRTPAGAVLPLALLAWASAVADNAALSSLSSRDAAAGLHAALSQGIDVAVAQLGAPGGFLNDPKVTIPLPHPLDKAEKPLRMLGLGAQADQLKETMNHAAEAAVAQAKPVFKQALQHMSITDAKDILTGGDGAGTAYFRKATSAELTAKFRPIVAAETAKLGLARKYDDYAGQAAQLGLLPAQDASLNDYVTARALDGLFSRIAEEEHEIRKDPMGQASSIIKKVYGPL